MITDNTNWHYLALKNTLTSDNQMRPTQSILRLFSRITSTNTTKDYYCLYCFHSYRTEGKLKEYELVCEYNDYCAVLMPDNKHKIIKYATGPKSLKMAHAIYGDIECLLKKHHIRANDSNKSWSRNVNTHVPTGYSISVVNEYKENYHSYYRGKDCMEKLSKNLLRIAKEIINEEKKPMTTITDDEKIKHEESKKCYLRNQSFNTNKKSKYYKNYKKT